MLMLPEDSAPTRHIEKVVTLSSVFQQVPSPHTLQEKLSKEKNTKQTAFSKKETPLTMIKYILQTAFINRHPGVLLWNALQLINVFAGYNGELKSATPYSKFAHTSSAEQKEAMIPSRLGMLIIYGPATITGMLYLLVLPLYFESFQPSLAAWMVLIHFAKRTLEVVFLHKYSGSSALAVARMIGVFYALGTFMISATAVSETNEVCSQLGNGKYCDVFLYTIFTT